MSDDENRPQWLSKDETWQISNHFIASQNSAIESWTEKSHGFIIILLLV